MPIRKTLWACCGGVAALVMASTAQAESGTGPITANAENIRKLNIMLMVTSLRCRESSHDFRGEYDLFAKAHDANLSIAHDHLKRKMAAIHGESGTDRALDRLGVTTANSYGKGHPVFGCADLKRATLQLAMSQDSGHLATMAGKLLNHDRASAGTGSPAHPGAAERPSLPHDLRAPDAPVAKQPDAIVPSPRAKAIPSWLRG